jgi:hypothetical protein
MTGMQNGINASAGLIYPTALRANGVSYALGVGGVGAISQSADQAGHAEQRSDRGDVKKEPLAAPAFASCCCASERQGAKPAPPLRRGALQDRRTRTSCGHVVDYLPKTPQ